MKNTIILQYYSIVSFNYLIQYPVFGVFTLELRFSLLHNQCMFTDLKFQNLYGKNVYAGNIEKIPVKEKSKFPQNFFPEVS